MEYLRTYEGDTYRQLPGALQTRIDETELIVHLIRAGTPEPVKFNIFARLNTGGTPLTLQELRHALIPGRARTLLKELADGEPFRDATQGSVKPQRMADREMVLRFLAFRLTEPSDYPRGDLDDFLRKAMKRLNDLPEQQIERLSSDFARSMYDAVAVFGQHAFRKVFAGQTWAVAYQQGAVRSGISRPCQARRPRAGQASRTAGEGTRAARRADGRRAVLAGDFGRYR